MRILLLLAMALTSISFSVEKERSEQPVVATEQITTTTQEEVVDSTIGIPVVFIETTTTQQSTTTTTIPETTTTTTLHLPEDGKCTEWWEIAVSVGWPEELLPQLGRIMWSESRCLPDVTGTGAIGLTQIQWSAHSHWVTDLGYIRENLFIPVINLEVAWVLYNMAEEDYGCGFQPWYMSGDWC
jgi:hypothetical protein